MDGTRTKKKEYNLISALTLTRSFQSYRRPWPLLCLAPGLSGCRGRGQRPRRFEIRRRPVRQSRRHRRSGNQRQRSSFFFTFDEKGPEPAMFPALFQTSFKNRVGGSIAQWLAYLLSDPAAPGLIPSIHNFFQRNNCQSC